jgi:hypothetical protein
MSYIITKSRPIVIPKVDFLPKQKEIISHNSTLALQFKELKASSINTGVIEELFCFSLQNVIN